MSPGARGQHKSQKKETTQTARRTENTFEQGQRAVGTRATDPSPPRTERSVSQPVGGPAPAPPAASTTRHPALLTRLKGHHEWRHARPQKPNDNMEVILL